MAALKLDVSSEYDNVALHKACWLKLIIKIRMSYPAVKLSLIQKCNIVCKIVLVMMHVHFYVAQIVMPKISIFA